MAAQIRDIWLFVIGILCILVLPCFIPHTSRHRLSVITSLWDTNQPRLLKYWRVLTYTEHCLRL